MRPGLVLLGLLSLGGVAAADDTRVRTSATVEVLDDRATVDDVISRMRQQQQRDAAAHKPGPPLKQERPPAPPSSSDTQRSVGPDAKVQPPGTRRPTRDRSSNPDQTERPRPKRK
jgi:hypothetical protein